MKYVEVNEKNVNFLYDEKTKEIYAKIEIKNIFNLNIVSKLFINSSHTFISNPSVLFIKPNEMKEFNIIKKNNIFNNEKKDLFLIINYPTKKDNLTYSEIKEEFNKIDKEKITIKQKIKLEGIYLKNNIDIIQNLNDNKINDSNNKLEIDNNINSFERNLSNSSSNLFKNLIPITNRNKIDFLNERIDEKHKEIENLKKNFKLSKIKLNNLYNKQKNDNLITNKNNFINNMINFKNTNINTILKNKYSTYLTLIIVMCWFTFGAFINKLKANYHK